MKRQRYAYKALNFFLLRTPVISFDMYKSFFPEKCENKEYLKSYTVQRMIELSNDPAIKEAISVSSPRLHESLFRLQEEDDPRKQEQVLKGLMRYVLRMMTRPTPFGLFSGVTVGHFGETSQLYLKNTNAHRKRARPDMEWILKIIEKIESIPEVLCQLRLQSNPLIYRQGNRAKIPYTTRYGKLVNGENDSVSVKASAVFDYIMEVCAQPVLYSTLVKLVMRRFSEAGEERVDPYIRQLFEQEFLISELRPSTIKSDPFGHILAIVNPLYGMEDLKLLLQSIHQDILLYNELPIGEGEERLNLLRQVMSEVSDIEMSTLQVDLSLEDHSIVLNEYIRKDVERVAELFSQLASKTDDHLKEYADEFLEKYGYRREVPLLELLDEEMGLGAPATYRHPQSRRRSLKTGKIAKTQADREQLLFQWFISSIHKGKYEMNLTDEMTAQLAYTEDSITRPALPSMELYFLLNTRDQQALDRGEYTLLLGPNPGSNGAGKTFGRFMDLLGKPFEDEFQAIHQEEKSLYPEKIWAEVSYLPSSGRTTNVILVENFRDYEIAIGTSHALPDDQQIQVSDLVVGLRDDHFYLKSRKHNREVIPTTGHMLNYHHAPNVYRFLIEVGLAGFGQWNTINWGIMAQAPFTPRLRYNNIIFAPATWRMWFRQDKEKPLGAEALKKAVAQFCLEWKVPRHVYLIQSDHRILLDLEHPLHIEELCKELKSGNSIALIEHIGGFEELPIYCSEGRLTAEFVFPLVRRPVISSGTLQEIAAASEDVGLAPSMQIVSSAQRVHFPGGVWFYAKLYGMESRQNEFIGLYWDECIRQAKEMGIVEYAYYIRYADPESHIRVRFKMSSEKLVPDFFTMFHDWAKVWIREGLITKFVIDTYEPEIERYGGPELMGLAESMFADDSEVAAKLIRLNRFKQNKLDLDIVAVLSVIHLLRQLGFNEVESYDVLNQKYDVREFLGEFRKERRFYLDLLDKAFAQGEGQSQNQINDILDLFKIRETTAYCYQQKILEQEKQSSLMNTKEDILFSIIHMHLNRLLGIDRYRERKIMIMARHAMNSLVHYHRKVI
ncbi:lantibiotic dehydratase [Paenibacillus polymyxa]|nr:MULTISPECIES: lantibiotic dehydratase [Paenibacillus]KAF6659318.1 lantibiotic dehydratase [Paenibacillus sp. EKM301P]RPE01820.1 hypothetical protein EG487_18275 [Paenibacillus polymyxa]UBS85859.1 lantibiotic dehydratase [Paenibacillus polymyxa]WHX34383.1 lantibiotic dehydratase [Paenibacillus polymyxa]